MLKEKDRRNAVGIFGARVVDGEEAFLFANSYLNSSLTHTTKKIDRQRKRKKRKNFGTFPLWHHRKSWMLVFAFIFLCCLS